MTLGQKLKALLKDNHMTQEDLAEKLDVSRQAVGKWVNDKGIPFRIRRKSCTRQRLLCQSGDVRRISVI